MYYFLGIRKFALWAQKQGVDPAQLDQNMIFDYLTYLDKENASMSTIEKVENCVVVNFWLAVTIIF